MGYTVPLLCLCFALLITLIVVVITSSCSISGAPIAGASISGTSIADASITSASSRGEYGVIHSIVKPMPTAICNKTEIGVQGSDLCFFRGVVSIADAIRICDINPQLCKGFIYSDRDRCLSFIDIQQELEISPSLTQHTAYLRQGVEKS